MNDANETTLYGYALNAQGKIEGRITRHERRGNSSHLTGAEWTGQTFKTWKAAEEWSFQQNKAHAGRA